jgi:hypothetical protein
MAFGQVSLTPQDSSKKYQDLFKRTGSALWNWTAKYWSLPVRRYAQKKPGVMKGRVFLFYGQFGTNFPMDACCKSANCDLSTKGLAWLAGT